MPTKAERLSPSLVDIHITGCKPEGKTNRNEANAIVSRIEGIVLQDEKARRSIGIISFFGSDQCCLIRTCLLDALGAKLYKECNILIGEPPCFQGVERDIVFVSLVCSPGSVQVQNKLEHMHNANIALSRARDQMILVRSVDCTHILNYEDIKIPIISFFLKTENSSSLSSSFASQSQEKHSLFSFRNKAKKILGNALQNKGYIVSSMEAIWNNSICVEDEKSGLRCAISIDCGGESEREWNSLMNHQKKIEQIGWECLRCDAFQLVSDFFGTLQYVQLFLTAAGVTRRAIPEKVQCFTLPATSKINQNNTTISTAQTSSKQNSVADNIMTDVNLSSQDSMQLGFQNININWKKVYCGKY